MISCFYLLVLLFSFAVSTVSVLFFAHKNRALGVVGRDVNKKGDIELPEGTGIALLAPVWLSILAFNAIAGFSIDTITFGLTISGLSLVGLADDRKHKFKTKTISWKSRAMIIAFICLIFALMYAPSPLWVIPFLFFIAGLASFENTFAGLNGLEIGNSLVISCFVAYILAGSPLFPLAVAMVGAVAGLFLFNAFPAKVFPGDSGTLLIGGGIACLAVLSQDIYVVFLTALFFVPHAIDFFALKMLTNPHDASQSRQMPYALRRDGRLETPKYHDRKARLDFVKMLFRVFGPMYEWQVVALIWIIVALNCGLWTAVFRLLSLV